MSAPRKSIERRALVFDRGKDRRYLLDFATKPLENALNLGVCYLRYKPCFDDSTGYVLRIRYEAELE